MISTRVLNMKYRNKLFYQKEKDKNGQIGQSPNENFSETDILREDHFQNHVDYYVSLNREKAVSRKKIFMAPHQFMYLAKALFKLSKSDKGEYKQVINFFKKMNMNSEQLFSPHFSPLLLNDIEQFEQRLHNCELLNKNNHFIKHLPLVFDTQLRSDGIPFLLIEKSEFAKDVDDKENKLKGMICGLANHRGGYIITCQSFTRNRIRSGLKEITKALIENIKFKLEVVLNTIVRKQDIGIEVNSIRLKQPKQPDGKEEVEKEYVILIEVKINPERSSCGFYIDRKKYNELYKQQLYANEQQLKSQYNEVIDEMRKESPKLQVKKFSKQKLEKKNASALKRLFYEEYQNEWISKEVKEYEEIRKIMKFNMKREALEDFKWKQNFIAGISLHIKQIRIKQIEYINLSLSKNEDNHLRQICNYLMSRKQKSKKEIAQFFSEIPNQYSVGLIIHGQNLKESDINNILQGLLIKALHKQIVPFEELQIQIGKQRSNHSKTNTDTKIFQNYCYYVCFKGHYQALYEEFKKKLNKNNLMQVTMDPVKVKSKVGSFLTSEDWIILNKTIYDFFNVVPEMTKKLDGKYKPENQFKKQQIKYCPAFFEGKSWIDQEKLNQKQPYKYNQVEITFKGNELNASVFCQFLLFLAKKRPRASQV